MCSCSGAGCASSEVSANLQYLFRRSLKTQAMRENASLLLFGKPWDDKRNLHAEQIRMLQQKRCHSHVASVNANFSVQQHRSMVRSLPSMASRELDMRHAAED